MGITAPTFTGNLNAVAAAIILGRHVKWLMPDEVSEALGYGVIGAPYQFQKLTSAS